VCKRVNRGSALTVLVSVRLVDDQVVTAGLLELHTFVEFECLQLRDSLLQRLLRLLDPFDRRVRSGAGLRVEFDAKLNELTLQMLTTAIGVNLDPLEHTRRDDDHVPVLDCGLRDELSPVVITHSASSGKNIRRGIPLFGLARHLLDQMRGHHKPRLGNQPSAFELHRPHEHRASLARAHDMIKKNGRLGDHPSHCRPLVRVR